MIKKLRKRVEYKTFVEPIIHANPVSVAVLGICSALAVTTQLKPSFIMALSMTFVLMFSNMIIFLNYIYLQS